MTVMMWAALCGCSTPMERLLEREQLLALDASAPILSDEALTRSLELPPWVVMLQKTTGHLGVCDPNPDYDCAKTNAFQAQLLAKYNELDTTYAAALEPRLRPVHLGWTRILGTVPATGPQVRHLAVRPHIDASAYLDGRDDLATAAWGHGGQLVAELTNVAFDAHTGERMDLTCLALHSKPGEPEVFDCRAASPRTCPGPFRAPSASHIDHGTLFVPGAVYDLDALKHAPLHELWLVRRDDDGRCALERGAPSWSTLSKDRHRLHDPHVAWAFDTPDALEPGPIPCPVEVPVGDDGLLSLFQSAGGHWLVDRSTCQPLAPPVDVPTAPRVLQTDLDGDGQFDHLILDEPTASEPPRASLWLSGRTGMGRRPVARREAPNQP